MDVSVLCRILSFSNAFLFRQHFQKDPQKFALANFIEITVTTFQIMQSLVIEDEKIFMKSAFRFHHIEQDLNPFVEMITNIKWYSKDGPSPAKGSVGSNGGPKYWNLAGAHSGPYNRSYCEAGI